jgi:ribonuclease III
MVARLYPQRQRQLEKLVQKLGMDEDAPVQWSLLDLALTHPTVSSKANYEQLEFVGDAVVRMAVAEFLIETYPELPVGEFTAIRSVLVSDRILAQLASSYGLERYLLVSESAMSDAAGQESRLAEAFEAVLGALYLSTHTLALIRFWLNPHLQRLAREVQADPARQNYKAALQEWTQAHYKMLPEYRVQETSPGHHQIDRFTAQVWFQGQQLGQGTGRSIKQAEQAAAQAAFLAIQTQDEEGSPLHLASASDLNL